MSLRAYIRQLWGLRTAFRRTFNGPDGKPHEDGKAVLAEIRRFCHGGRPTIKRSPSGNEAIDPYASIAAAARQEVWFRIADMLNLDDSDLAALERRAQMEDAQDG